MSGQQPASVHLRRLVPLIAVVGLLGPGAAVAGVPAPDQPPGTASRCPIRHPWRTRTWRPASPPR